MRKRKYCLIAFVLLSCSLGFASSSSTDILRRVKRNEEGKVNATNPLGTYEKNEQSKEQPVTKVEAHKDSGEGETSSRRAPTKENHLGPGRVTKQTTFQAEKGLLDDKFEDVQNVWQSLEARNRHHYEPWLRFDGGISAPFHAEHAMASEGFYNEPPRSSHYRHDVPLAYTTRLVPKRHGGLKKNGKRRRTVLFFHSPFAKEQRKQNMTHHLNNGELEDAELEHGLDGPVVERLKTREVDASKFLRPLRYYEYPPYAWESPRVAFEERFGAAKLKHIEPADSFCKLADMMINKIKTDTKMFAEVAPYRAQITKISATPDLVISATTNTRHDMEKLAEIPPFDAFKTEGEATAYGTLQFAPPLQLGSNPGEPKKILNLIEDAIDNMVVDHDPKEIGEEEIEVHCPVHQKQSVNSGTALASGSSEHSKGEGYEVCQCHFVKKKKD